MTTPTTPTTLTCEADTSGRDATRAHACGLPATMGFRTTSYDHHRPERIEARCAKHAGVIKRTRWPAGQLVDLTPEVVDAIATRQTEAKARRDAERAAKREQDAIRPKPPASRPTRPMRWPGPRSAPTRTLDGWDGTAPIYRPVPRWVVRPEGIERTFDDIEVRVEARVGWPASIGLRAGSRLTQHQAIALAEALLAASAIALAETIAATGDDHAA